MNTQHSQHSRVPRVRVFVDGQNLFNSAKTAFGHTTPNYDIINLSEAIADAHGCYLDGCNFYTGVPSPEVDERWFNFWTRKLADMSRSGVSTFSPPLRYLTVAETLPDGTTRAKLVGREKGVDLRLGLDIVKAALSGQCSRIVVVSRDNDLCEAVKDALLIANDQRRELRVFSAFPVSERCNHYGIRGTESMPLDADFYNRHLEQREAYQFHGAQERATSSARPPRSSGRSDPQLDSAAQRAGRAARYIQSGARHSPLP